MPVRFEPSPLQHHRFNPTLAAGNHLAESVRRSQRHGGTGNGRDAASARVSHNITNMLKTGESKQALARRAAARIHRPNHVFSRVSNMNMTKKKRHSAPAAAAPDVVALQSTTDSQTESPSMYWWAFMLMVLIPIIFIVIIVCGCGSNSLTRGTASTLSTLTDASILK